MHWVWHTMHWVENGVTVFSTQVPLHNIFPRKTLFTDRTERTHVNAMKAKLKLAKSWNVSHLYGLYYQHHNSFVSPPPQKLYCFDHHHHHSIVFTTTTAILLFFTTTAITILLFSPPPPPNKRLCRTGISSFHRHVSSSKEQSRFPSNLSRMLF